jgi:hypothetical protein
MARREAPRRELDDLGGTLVGESVGRLAGRRRGPTLDPDRPIAAVNAAGSDKEHHALRVQGIG